jgi:hypothetical protein
MTFSLKLNVEIVKWHKVVQSNGYIAVILNERIVEYFYDISLEIWDFVRYNKDTLINITDKNNFEMLTSPRFIGTLIYFILFLLNRFIGTQHAF